MVRNDFDLTQAFGANTIDIVFSNAAFEHFDDMTATVEQLSVVCKSGAVIVAEIDLKTHSRWIRDKDPNNIYRYHDSVYSIFKFRGTPNRMRPFEYKELFERFGWDNVTVTPTGRLAGHTSVRVSKAFRDEKNQMDYLSILLCAKKR